MAHPFNMRFDWDPAKDRANRVKHGLGFHEAKALFSSDVDYLEIFDETHSDEEERFIAIGPIRRGIVVVVYMERVEDVIRISAPFATTQERELFDKHVEGKP
jgi:hypothetical protein